MGRIIKSLRRLRELHPWIKLIHRGVRGPYYWLLTWLFPRGMVAKLASSQIVRLHPCLLGMRPETYEIELTRLLVSRIASGATIVDIGAHLGFHTLTFSRLV